MKILFTGCIAILYLFSQTAFAANDTLINSNASWKYLDNGSNQGTAWKALSFNDAGWASGMSQLGIGDINFFFR